MDSLTREEALRQEEKAFRLCYGGPGEVHRHSAFPPVDQQLQPATQIDATIKERGSNYGQWADNARGIQQIKHTFQVQQGWVNLHSYQKEALEMMAVKIGRILAGNPDHADSWHDIAGYAILTEEAILKGEGGK